MTTQEKIEVMKASLEGKTIECRYLKDNSAQWEKVAYTDWNWFECEYRVKPESETIEKQTCKYIYEFYLGDKYADGHGKHEIFQYEMNITANEFNAALDKFNLETNQNCLSWFQDYEAHEWQPDMKDALNKIGLDHKDYTDDIDPENPDYAGILEKTTYIDLMFNIVKHYIPHFEWKPFTFDKGPGHLCIEGKAYGLFD